MDFPYIFDQLIPLGLPRWLLFLDGHWSSRNHLPPHEKRWYLSRHQQESSPRFTRFRLHVTWIGSWIGRFWLAYWVVVSMAQSVMTLLFVWFLFIKGLVFGAVVTSSSTQKRAFLASKSTQEKGPWFQGPLSWLRYHGNLRVPPLCHPPPGNSRPY